MVKVSREANLHDRRFRIPVALALAVLALLIAYSVAPDGANSLILWICLFGQYAVVVAAIFRPITVYPGIPTFVTTEFLFQFFSYLIFFYPYQLHVLGIYDVSQSVFFQNTFVDQSNRAIILSLIGTLSFSAGIRAMAVRNESLGDGARVGLLDRVSVGALAVPVFALQALFIVAYEAFGWRAAGEGRYSGEVTTSPVVEGVYLAIIVLSMIAVALRVHPASTGDRSSIFLTLAVLTAVFWSTRLLLSGDRNVFLLIAIVGVGGLVSFRVRVGRWLLVVLGIVAIPMYNAIEALRSGRIRSVFDFFSAEGAAAASYGGDTSFNITTIGVRAALARVPEAIDFGYGLYKLVGVAGVIPFIRGLVLPSDLPHLQSADVLGDIMLGPQARWGVGSNVVVDAYVDFGVIAVPTLLFGLGAFVAVVQRAMMRMPDSPWRTVMYMLTLAFVAEIPRYSLDFPVRPLVWTLMLFFAIAVLGRSNHAPNRRSGTMRPAH
ncbi:oligosaccharide repeat unit polymerase [Mycobacterium sp. NPDC003323]